MQRRPQIPALCAQKMSKRNRSQHNCLPTSRLHISDQCMPRQAWRLQQPKLCMKILPWPGTQVPWVKQPPQASCGNHNQVGQYHLRQTISQQLRPLHDQQYNIGGLAQQKPTSSRMVRTQSKQLSISKWLVTMPPTTSHTESENTADIIAAPTTRSQTPSPGMTTVPTNF